MKTKREIIQIAEQLGEALNEYAYEVENDDRNNFSDDFILDGLCDMQEILRKDGIEEGRYYTALTLVTDKAITLYETVDIERVMSGTKGQVKVMMINSVKPSEDGKLIIEFLGKKLK